MEDRDVTPQELSGPVSGRHRVCQKPHHAVMPRSDRQSLRPVGCGCQVVFPELNVQGTTGEFNVDGKIQFDLDSKALAQALNSTVWTRNPATRVVQERPGR